MGIRGLETDGRALPGERAAAWELAAKTTSAAEARSLTRETLGTWHVADPADIDDIVLMVDELITNAVVHGTGPVRLRLRLTRTATGPVLVAEVTDDNPQPPRPSGVTAEGLDWSEAGRGMLLVQALSTDSGDRPEGQGKTVWFSRLLHPPAGRNGQAAPATVASAEH